MALLFSDSPKGSTSRYSCMIFDYSSVKLMKPPTNPELGWRVFSRLICAIIVTLSIYHSNLGKTKSQFQSISTETNHLMYCQVEKHCSYFKMQSIFSQIVYILDFVFLCLKTSRFWVNPRKMCLFKSLKLYFLKGKLTLV